MSLTEVRESSLNIDTLQLKGVTMPAKTFRRCIFILDELLSCYDCFQFLAPVPLTAVVYHTEIKRPMDFKTLEYNLFGNKYEEYNDFVKDLCLIWENAKLFHRSFDTIYQQAENLNKRFNSLSEFILGGPRPFYLSTSNTDIEFILSALLPEERMLSILPSTFPSPAPEPEIVFPMYKELEPPKKSNLYFVQALSEEDCNTKKLRGFSNVRLLFQHLNASFFSYISSPDKRRIPLPRFYIAKNRTLLNEAGTDPNGALAILYNVNIKPFTKDLYRLQATVVLCEPMGITHGFDESSMDKSDEYEFCPKAWVKLRVIKVVEGTNTVINADMDRSFFKKVYNMYKLSSKVPGDLKKIGDQDIAKEFVHSILNPVNAHKQEKQSSTTINMNTDTTTAVNKTKNQTSPPAKAPASKPITKQTGVTSSSTESSKVLNPIDKKTKATHSRSRATNSKPTTTHMACPKPTPSKPASRVSSPKPSTEAITVTPTETSSKNIIRITPPVLERSEEKSSSPSSSRPVIRLVLKNHDKPNTEPSSSSENNEMMATDEVSQSTEALHAARSPSTENIIIKQEPNTETTTVTYERYLQDSDVSKEPLKNYYIDTSKALWQKLRDYAKEKDVPVVNINKYTEKTSSYPNAEGFFKYVYFLREDNQKVLQTFRRMTISQRTTEIASLLALKGLPHMGQITEVLEESHGEIIGLSMQRYEKTLKQYTHAHSHHRLTAYQKMDLIIQMLECIETIHNVGLAHRDLSEVNFMVNETDEKLRDGSPRAELFLIDFGKSKFTTAKDVRRWWIEHPVENTQEYDGEIVPLTKEDLELWCQQLPWIRAKPDHGYRLYRSVQTLPRNRTDTEDLPWLVNPLSEDIYSLGTIIWKTFSETEPWYGILDTDLKGLRETVGEDYHIERSLDREVPGKLSKELLLKFLKVSPEYRKTATEVLEWLKNIDVQNGLIKEWEEHAPVGRQKRHAKALFRYDDEQAATTDLTPQRKKQKSNNTTTTNSNNNNHISHAGGNTPLLQLHIPTRSLSPLFSSQNSASSSSRYPKSSSPNTNSSPSQPKSDL